MSCLRIHTGDRPYRCVHPGCEKAFTQLSNLQVIINSPHGLEWIHNPVVTSQVWFSVRVCLPPPTSKKSHQRQHNKDKPFKCSNCFRAYSDSASLQTHLPAHAIKNAKAYCCSMCGRAYTSVSAPPLTAPPPPAAPRAPSTSSQLWRQQFMSLCLFFSRRRTSWSTCPNTRWWSTWCATARLCTAPTLPPFPYGSPSSETLSARTRLAVSALVRHSGNECFLLSFESIIGDTQRWRLGTLRRGSGRPITFILYASS